jgi:hypothetical protein
LYVRIGPAFPAVLAACVHQAPPPEPPKKATLAVVLPAYSDEFPKAASALSSSLGKLHIVGVDETRVSKVSLMDVQLQIEPQCIDPTVECWNAVGRSLSANQLVFALLKPGAKKKTLPIQVVLFDVDSQTVKKTKELDLPNEDAAVAQASELVEGVTAP